jgi:tetratricopeptide (TPR) repeat protein
MSNFGIAPTLVIPLPERIQLSAQLKRAIKCLTSGNQLEALNALAQAEATAQTCGATPIQIHRMKGTAFLRGGHFEGARKEWAQWLELDSENFAPGCNLGYVLFRQEKWEAAQACYITLLERFSGEDQSGKKIPDSVERLIRLRLLICTLKFAQMSKAEAIHGEVPLS